MLDLGSSHHANCPQLTFSRASAFTGIDDQDFRQLRRTIPKLPAVDGAGVSGARARYRGKCVLRPKPKEVVLHTLPTNYQDFSLLRVSLLARLHVPFGAF